MVDRSATRQVHLDFHTSECIPGAVVETACDIGVKRSGTEPVTQVRACRYVPERFSCDHRDGGSRLNPHSAILGPILRGGAFDQRDGQYDMLEGGILRLQQIEASLGGRVAQLVEGLIDGG